MQSIHSVITWRFFRQALIPILIVETSLVLTLFLLNDYQSKSNKQALQEITKESFQEIALQTSGSIAKRFAYDRLNLTQIQKITDILLMHAQNFTVSPNSWHYRDSFFQLNLKEPDAQGFYPLPASEKTAIYTTNLTKLGDEDYKSLTALSLLLPSIRATVDTQNDLISAAWINIDKRYAMAYPPINPAEELSHDLDVTQYPFYYLADPEHNPSRKAVFIPLYKESWAIDNGELGAYLMPIYKEDQFLGVIGLTLTGKAVADVIQMMDLPFNAYALLVDRENHLIVSSDPEAAYRDFNRHSFYELYLHPEYKERSLMQLDLNMKDADDNILFRQPIPDSELTLIICAKKEDVFATVNTITKHNATIGYAFVIGIAVFYFFFSFFSYRSIRRLATTITSPLQSIVAFSSKLGRKEDVTLEESSIDELQELNSNLNETHEKLLQMVIKDEATGLYNRHKLIEDLANEEARSLMLIQLSNYKTLHNLYGQEAADTVVSGIVNELKKHTAIQSYRIGDDDFAVLSHQKTMEPFTVLFDALSSLTISFESIQIHPFLFAGMAGKDDSSISLIEQAGMALLHAQRSIASYPVCYKDAQMIKEEFENNLSLSNRLNQALKEDRLLPYFQPIFNLKTNKIDKFESLVRMIDGDDVISPLHFLPPAAAMGKTHEITRIMIDKVLRTAAHYPDVSFNINISFKDFEEFDLIGYIQSRCEMYQVSPKQITFELLETDAINNAELVLKGISRLKHAGFSIAIDDFGSGHSNFAHLMSMQVDYIKIDGQFVKNIIKDPNSATITKTIAQFASLVGAKTVAEFVSEKAILKRIRQFDIDYAQGYVISPPLPQGQINAILHKDFNTL
ncbi:MAG: EAL domain-containing protein [Campylobacterota bacterium]|nr:EAL domain-containing protein [Campylobacterota bacterium]